MSPRRPPQRSAGSQQRFNPCSYVIPVLASLVFAGCRDAPTAPAGEDAAGSVLAAAVGSWTSSADYPRDVWEPASASITNPATQRTVVYVIGGTLRRFGGAGAVTDAVKAYDVSANRWRSKASYPVRVQATNGAVEIGGKIYVSGGFTRRLDEQRGGWRLETLKSLYVYDPATDRWSRRRYDNALCGEQFDQGALWRYNPATDRWVLLGRTPHDPWDAGGGFIDGKLYLVEFLGAVDIYDVASNSWSGGAQRPFRACSPASTTLQAKLYLVGCRDDFDESGDYPMLVFDPAAESWSEAAAPPVPADDHWTLSRVVVNGRPRLQLVGGPTPRNNWQFVP